MMILFDENKTRYTPQRRVIARKGQKMPFFAIRTSRV